MNTASRHTKWQPALICVLLVLATLAVYWPARLNEFIEYDDQDYITANAQVQRGLTWQGLGWAFRTGHSANWHPVTWLSHMLDVELYGLEPAGHHLTNVLLHCANAVLLFLLFRRMTSALWRSAFVAALFALHPLHVESVAWVAERKDLLSTLFGLLAIWAYALYAEKSKVQGPKSKVAGAAATPYAPRPTQHAPPQPPASSLQPPAFYALALSLFGLSLMSKPMLVTLPFLLLLLDYWPLNRCQLKTQDPRLKTLLPLLVEKLPFLLLSALSSAATLMVQQPAMLFHRELGFAARAANAVVSCVRYLGKTFWPQDLAVFYPHPLHWPVLSVAGSTLLLVLISGLVLWQWRRRPYLPVGWFWFLGVLVPVLGLVQVGLQAMADRYTYLPLVGVFLAVAWGAVECMSSRRVFARAGIASALLLVMICAVVTRAQLRVWRNTETIFAHARTAIRNNYVAHHELGVALADQHRFADARIEFAAALKIKPDYSPALSDMAKLHYREGELATAATLLKQALASNPNDALAHSNLAITLAHQGRTEEALPHYRKAIELKPDSPEALNNLAWFLATQPSPELRNGAEAVSLAEQACGLTQSTNLWMVSTLAAAYAEAGRFAEAVTTQQKVCALATAQGQTSQMEPFQRRLDLYRSRQPYHEP